MTRPRIGLLLAGAASLAIAAPVAAQMNHANMPGMTMPMPAKKPAAKKPAAKKPSAKKPAAKKAPVRKRPTAPVAKPDQPAGHDKATVPVSDMPAGHDMPTMPPQPANPATDPSGGHDMSSMPNAPAGTDLPAGNAPPPPAPTDHAADAVFGSEIMAMGRHHLQQAHGGQKLFQVLANIAEYHVREGRDAIEWDAEGWYGGDINRFWFKTEGEGKLGGAIETAEARALYSRAFDPYWNFQAGVRYDFKPDPSRFYATVGLEGLAPNFFDVEGAIFLSNKGELMARAEGWYDQRITQRLILQPRAEIDLAAQNSRDIGVGAGLSQGEIGVRLRYDLRREFAPYVGVQYNRTFGRTRRYRTEEGERPDGWSLLTGIRMWF